MSVRAEIGQRERAESEAFAGGAISAVVLMSAAAFVLADFMSAAAIAVSGAAAVLAIQVSARTRVGSTLICGFIRPLRQYEPPQSTEEHKDADDVERHTAS